MSKVTTSPASGNRGTRYITLQAVYERYGGSVSLWTLRERARRGEIPHLKHPGAKSPVFREDWLDEWDNGAELERRVLRQRGKSAGRVVRPKATAKRRAA